MASYHISFNYLDKNSAEQGYIITAFEPDDGFKDAFLDMDQISEDYYDGTKKFLYGARYNSTASINITLVKMDGTDWSVNDNRKALRWLTGSRTASWLDLCQYKDGEKGWIPSYSFLGTVKSPQQYKLDGRVIGISFEFASITPWAYSPEQTFNRSIEQALNIDDKGVLFANELSISEDGVMCNGVTPGPGACFCIDEYGTLYVENIIVAQINNDSDDLYSYIYLDIEYTNDTCDWLEIKRELDENIKFQLDELSVHILNEHSVEIGKYVERNADGEYVLKNTAGEDLKLSDLCKQYLRLKNEQYETTRIKSLYNGDIIHITGKQFIVAYTRDQLTGKLVNQERIFGDNFNFVWPRLAPGVNNLIVEGSGNGTVKFSYRYPMKVGDCAMDINTYGSNVICECGNNISSYDTVRWQDITDTPTTIEGYGITNAYNINEINDIISNIDISGVPGSGGGSITINENELNEMLNNILT